MGRRSRIEQLPQPVLAEVHGAIKRGCTIDEITALLAAMGAPEPRSNVGRYTKKYSDMAARQREQRNIAAAFGEEFGGGDSDQARMLLQLLNSVMTRAMMELASDDDVEVDGREMHFLARAAKDMMSARKIGVEGERLIRDEQRRHDAEAGAQAARESGASEATIELIRRKILGLGA